MKNRSLIQAAARRFLAVRVVARRRKEKYFNEVIVPSAILLQQKYRTHRAIKLFKVAKVRYRAAIKIQSFYRGCLAAASMREAFAEMEKAYRDKLATALQSAFRAYKARCRFQGVKMPGLQSVLLQLRKFNQDGGFIWQTNMCTQSV